MPYPLNYHVADSIVRVIQTRVILSEHQTDRIRTFLRSMPVRVVLDLFGNANEEIATLPMEDSMFVNTTLDGYFTPYQEQFQLILDEIRVIYGQPSWYPTDSHLRPLGIEALERMRDLEANDGFTSDERVRLYEMTTTLVNEILNAEDDDDSVISTATAETVPLENNLGDLINMEHVNLENAY
jgi:hypothetical protein